MNNKFTGRLRKALTNVYVLLAITGFGRVNAQQAPSSLSYPASNVFIANVTNVYMAPNLSGNAVSYSISPALPAGLAFNTNTGLISGTPTAASATTTYTIVAFGAVAPQQTGTTVSIQVTNNFFNNSYSTINFGGAGVTLMHGTTGAVIASSTSPGYGSANNEIIVYQNVVTLGGQSIDCIVKTLNVTSGTTMSAYDQNDVSGSNFSSNDPRYFSPQFVFPAGTSGGPGGSIQFDFQFILGGSYSTVTKSGTNVVLQNVKINTYDIDGGGSSFSNQLNEFGGFASSETGDATTIQAPVFNPATGLTTYRSNVTTNSSVVTADPTRVRLTYNNMSDFSIRLGGGGTAYFFLDFSTGPAFSTSDTTTTPIVDLNTGMIGVNQAGAGCGSNLAFTPAGQTNVTASANLTQFLVSFPVSEIVNGANERLIADGATSGGTIALHTDPSGTLVLGGVTYNVSGATTAGVRTITFQRTPFTVAQAEALLDALQYNNNAANPASGSRNFTVNARNASFQSPSAVFTATLNCVTISGNVFHDVNGMVDGTVNASGTAGQFTAGSVFVARINPVNNQVIDVQPIAAGGAYSFGTVTPGTYKLCLVASNVLPGTVLTTATLPVGGYMTTGEHLGADMGDDLLTDGKMTVTIGSQHVVNANFGLQIPPVTANTTIDNIPNPGGFNTYTLLPNTFNTSDADGTVDSIVINSFPAGANSIRIGNTVYTNGGACPVQVSSCTAWPGSVVVPFAAGNPVPAIYVDPAAENNTSVTINFAAWDNGRALSNVSNVTLNFIGSNNRSISGKVWNDADSNGLQGSGEMLVAPGDAGQTLYAVLVQQNHTYSGTPTVLAVTPVNTTTGYTFSTVPAGNDYTIQIIAAATPPVAGSAAGSLSPHMAQGWIGVSTVTDGNILNNLNTSNPVISISNLTVSKVNLNFGIERLPDATDITVTVPVPVLGTLFTLNGTGSNPPVPPATDPEDGTLGTGSSIVITTLPVYTTLKYNGIAVTAGQTIANFNPSLLQVQITMATQGKPGTSFQFNYLDAAGKADPAPATYTLYWGANLAVQLGLFTAKNKGSVILLDWLTYSEENNSGFFIERGTDGHKWVSIGFVPSLADHGSSAEPLDYHFTDDSPEAGMNYYRLKQTDMDGRFVYSRIEKVQFVSDIEIRIYPNPVSDLLRIVVTDWSSVSSINLSDMSGRVLLRSAHPQNGLYTAALPAGMYLLKIVQSNGVVRQLKIAKQ